VSALLALYLNVAVGVLQSLQKLPLVRPLAPTQSEAPFLLAQGGVLLAFLVFGIMAALKFHPERQVAARS